MELLDRLHPHPSARRLARRLLSQPTGDGGLGFGTVVTSGLFLAVILGLVVYLMVTRKDVADPARVTWQAA